MTCTFSAQHCSPLSAQQQLCGQQTPSKGLLLCQGCSVKTAAGLPRTTCCEHQEAQHVGGQHFPLMPVLHTLAPSFLLPCHIKAACC